MEIFSYYNPVKIMFGPGERKKLGSMLKDKYKSVLLVCGKGPFREIGLFDEIKENIQQSGAKVFEMGDIDSNPKLSSVREGAVICKSNNIDCVVALGGGSTMDCTKAIAAAAKTDTDPWHFFWGDRIEIKDSLDTIMIPTIAATGTENNNWCVIVDDETHNKYFCHADPLFPKLTVMDPELTIGVPIRLTVWGAMDIMSHTLEYYLNGYESSIYQSRFSEAIIHSIIECVNILVKEPKDIIARGELMWCASMTWGGLTKGGRGERDASCHIIERGMGTYYDTHHGAGLGVVTPVWMKYVYREAPSAFARFARNIFGVNIEDDLTAAQKGIELYDEWLDKINAPSGYHDISNIEITDNDINLITDYIFKETNGPFGVIKKLHQEDVYNILKSCI